MNQHRPIKPSTYDADFYAWTREQARLIRKVGKGALSPDHLDWRNLAEEIEDLGRSQLHGVASRILQVLSHLIKAVSEPDARAVLHWAAETTAIQFELRRRYQPSMQQLPDIQALWEEALALAQRQLRVHGADLKPGLPSACPLSLAELIDPGFQFENALEKLAAPAAGGSPAQA